MTRNDFESEKCDKDIGSEYIRQMEFENGLTGEVVKVGFSAFLTLYK